MWSCIKDLVTFPPFTIMLILGFIYLVLTPFMPESERSRTFNESLDYNRRNGKYRVQYPDGQVSQPFVYDTAKTYAEMFGGKVIHR